MALGVKVVSGSRVKARLGSDSAPKGQEKIRFDLYTMLSNIEGCPELTLMPGSEQIYLIHEQQQVAFLYLQFLTGTHKRSGAVASFRPFGVVLESPIDKALVKLASHIPGVGALTHPYYVQGSIPTNFRQFSSELSKQNALYRDGGVISIYEKDVEAFDARGQEIAQGLFNYFVAPMSRYAIAAPDVKEDILKNPDAYTYPLSTIYIVQRLHNIEESSDEIIKNYATKRLKDKALLRKIAALPEELFLI